MKTADDYHTFSEDVRYQAFKVDFDVSDDTTVLKLLEVVKDCAERLDKMLQAQLKTNTLVDVQHGTPRTFKDPTIISLRYGFPTFDFTGHSRHSGYAILFVYFK